MMTMPGTSPKVLIIDDDPTLVKLLSHALEEAGYRPLGATNGLEGLKRLYEEHPALVILDVMMPRMDGWQTLGRIREVSRVPVLLLTAKDSETDKLQGFHAGADDYVTKPFSMAEVVARAGAILNRAGEPGNDQKDHVYQVGDLVIDVERHRVTKRGEPIQLTPTEFRLLQSLAENAGRILSPEQLLYQVWGPSYVGDSDYVKRYVWYLRRKIEDDPRRPTHLQTERGFGYVLRRE